MAECLISSHKAFFHGLNAFSFRTGMTSPPRQRQKWKNWKKIILSCLWVSGTTWWAVPQTLVLVQKLSSNSTPARLWVAGKGRKVGNKYPMTAVPSCAEDSLLMLNALRFQDKSFCSLAATFYEQLFRKAFKVALQEVPGNKRAVADPLASLTSVAEWHSDNWGLS